MIFDSPLHLKRRRLTNFDPMEIMESEAAKAKLVAAKVKYGRDICVFETFGTPQSSTGMADSEESDDLYEFTPEDYFCLLGTKKEDKYLKTRKIREAEEATRRSKATKAVIRVRFPDNHTLEATFHPSETIQSLFDLLKNAVARPELPFYLYTTPPKKHIQDMTQNFYSAGFVPGAIIYFSYDLPKENEAHSGPFLLYELLTLKGLEIAPEPIESIKTEPVHADPSPPVVQARKPVDKKAIKPKWLKM
ncbi:hypothetical protein V2J09_002581 [Rumex salicifolius]